MPGIDYRIALPSDAPQILQFIEEYFYPSNRVSETPWSQLEQMFVEIVDNCLKHKHSLIARVDSEVVGVLLNSVWRRGEDSESDNEYVKELEGLVPGEKMTFRQALLKCHVDFWDFAPPQVDAFIHREISAVATSWRRRGIAKEMSTLTLYPNFFDLKVGGITSATTSQSNQKLLAKLGFKCLKEYPYSEIVDSNGELLRITDGTEAIQLNFFPFSTLWPSSCD